jgi:glycosyltransferase involved in cell wall biosynthesis
LKTTLIIPALNEAACIGPLLAELPPALAHELLVVDNGSTDDTAGVAKQFGARVVIEPRRGYGYACAAGVAAASGDLLAFMDGDGSFIPGELAILLAPLLDDSADLVLGTRMRGGMAAGAMPPHQRFGNQLIARLMYRLYGLRLTDLGPFRVIRRDLLSTLEMREMTYGWPVEMIVKAARQGARIVELPVSYRPRSAGVSKVGGTIRGTILATYRILRTTFWYALGGLGQQRRLRT